MEIIKQVLKELVDWSIRYGMRLILSLLLLVIGLRIIKRLGRNIKKGKRFDRMDASLRSFLSNAVVVILDILLFITVAGIMGIPMASFVTVLASCGVAIGLALQGSLSNLAGGVMLLFFRPFKVGDYIEAADGESGTVKDITVFYTILRTPDNKTITIPNGTLTNSTVINYSTSHHRRVELDFSVAYETDMEQMKALLLEEANADSRVLQEPSEPFARLRQNGEHAMIYTLRVWVKAEDYWGVHYDLLEKITLRLKEEGICIPYPQIEVHTKD